MDADAAGNVAVVGNIVAGVRVDAGGGTTVLTTQTSLGGSADVLLLPDGTAIVAQPPSHRVLRAHPDGSLLTLLTASGDGVHALSQPVALARDPAGRLWVAGGASDNVFRIDTDASVTQMLGPEGAEGRALDQPSGLAVTPDGAIVVSAVGSDGLFRIAPEGSSPVRPTSAASSACTARDWIRRGA